MKDGCEGATSRPVMKVTRGRGVAQSCLCAQCEEECLDRLATYRHPHGRRFDPPSIPRYRSMPPDPGLVARVADCLLVLGERGIRQRNVFGGRGFLIGKSTFAIVWDDSLIVKTTAGEYEPLLGEPGVTPFAPDGEKSMSTWLVVSPDAIADDPELAEWIRRALRSRR